MKISIIETGLPPEALQADWPRYPVMFEQLLKAADPDLTFETVSIATGAPLPAPKGLDGVLITGSASGVYDPEPWMEPLFDFIRTAAEDKIPQFGVCFGHQAMAEALGGKAEKSAKGWGVGRHAYSIPMRANWMAGGPDHFALAVSHQDQVTQAPPNTETIAASEFCPHAGLSYGGFPAASFQGHPEFGPGYASALHELRRDRIGDALVDTAIRSFEAPLDSAEVARWMARFFRENRKTS